VSTPGPSVNGNGATSGGHASYPRRPKFFAHRVVRLAANTYLAQEIGPVGALLVIFIAHTEDAKRYSAPPTFYNDQLLPILGLCKWESLDKARRAAVESGWLHYDPPPVGKRRPGVYWVTIPQGFGKIDDQPSDEDTDRIQETDTPPHKPYPATGEREGERDGDRHRDREGELPTLIPNPDPDPKERYVAAAPPAPANGNGARTSGGKTATRIRFKPPPLDQVKALFVERGYKADPEKFYHYHESNGWVQGKARAPIKSWQSAAAYWESMQKEYSNGNHSNGSQRGSRGAATGPGQRFDPATADEQRLF
jgi:hypothetical protein